MDQLIKNGTITTLAPIGAVCEIKKLLGAGGQGEVYLAKIGNNQVALKWYYPSAATDEQRDSLQILVQNGAPNDRFLWPLNVVTADNIKGFGYIMPLRDPLYKNITDLMKNKVDTSFYALVTACMELAHSFLQLHSKGFCYRDISFGNVFFNPDNGEILICDNDNVAVDNGNKSGVLGTPKFMAPEIVRGESAPNSDSDRFSLAILLFYMLMVHHPLEGKKESSIKCLDLPAMNKLYGTNPIFIFDPQNKTNEPDPRYHQNAIKFWPIYPAFIRNLFAKTFTRGLSDVQYRVRESEWRQAMSKLRDSLIICPHCKAENFYDADASNPNEKTDKCWSCKKPLQLPFRIQVNNYLIMLNSGSYLYPHHIDSAHMYDFSIPVANVVQHPTMPHIWGLKNLSGEKWVVNIPGQPLTEVVSGKSITLANGTRINFGNSEGTIIY